MQPAFAPATGTEHRFLSVLFCDLVDSTGHQYRMEPEDFAALLSTYRRLVFGTVRRHGGHVARVIGDGVLAYFGWPRGSGRDAEAAVTCALAIGERIERLSERGELPAGTRFAVRMAVETGWVLVGNLGDPENVDANNLEQGDVVGHAPNVAARLQRLCPHNEVVIGEVTLSLLGHRFDIEPIDTSCLELPAPVRAARVARKSLAARTLRWLGEGRDGPFVGRGQESAVLMDHWQQAKHGSGRLVLVSGEPGIGKSRLGANLAAVVRSEARVMVLTCAEANIDIVLQPVAEQLRLSMGLTPNAVADAVTLKAERLVQRLGLRSDPRAVAAALGVPAPHMPPAELRQAVFQALMEITFKLAEERPLLLLVDDLQWADASTLALLRQLAERIATAPVLVLATHRANWSGEWPDAHHLHRMVLQPLTAIAATDLVEAVAGELIESLKAEIVARAEGNPFFVQEFARAMSTAGEDLNRLPGSISQLLAARLDSAGSARELAQYAAAVGHEVELELISDLSGLSSDALEAELDRLIELGILMRRPHGEAIRLAFCHALLADAAYEALTTSRRQSLHRRIADALCVRNPAIATSEPAVLGRHLAIAGDAPRAADLYHAAATYALGAAAFVESAAHARRALELARSVAGDTTRRTALAATVLLGEALSGTLGYASGEVHATFESAYQHALELGGIADLQPALRGLTAYYQIRGPLHRADELGRKTVQVARINGDPLMLAEAERRLGWCRFCQGDLHEARQLVESALRRLADYNGGRPDTPAVDDTAVRGPVVLALIAWLIDGDADALRIADEVAAAGRTFPRPMTVVYGLCFAAFIQQLCGQAAAARTFATLAGEIAQSRSSPYWVSLTDIVCGWSEVVDGDAAAGLVRLRAGLHEYERSDSTVLYPYALMLLADAQHRLGAPEEALAAVARGLHCAEDIGAHVYQPMLETIRGRILLGVDAAAARAALVRARDGALRQGAAAQLRRIDALAAEGGLVL
jgi:class 3 adenylate cyclase/tetratricopeptide (TPR) repeat protein